MTEERRNSCETRVCLYTHTLSLSHTNTHTHTHTHTDQIAAVNEEGRPGLAQGADELIHDAAVDPDPVLRLLTYKRLKHIRHTLDTR